MLRLMILRHLKTGWAKPGQRDFDRELEPRGVADGIIVSGWLGEKDLVPDHVYCSQAVRTRQTLDAIRAAFGRDVPATFHEDIYPGTAEDYLDIIRQHDAPQSVMIIGHNPSCAALANMMIDRQQHSDEDLAASAITYKYPTGALAVIDFDAATWADVRPGKGRLASFLMPKAYRDGE